MASSTWREVTEADLRTVIDNEELELYRERATSPAGNDPFDELILNAVNECRDRIRANRDNKLAAGNTLPNGMIARCLVLIRHRVLTLVKPSIGEDRRREMESTEQYLRDVAKGLVAIAQPDDVTSDETAPVKGKPLYQAPCRTNTYGI